MEGEGINMQEGRGEMTTARGEIVVAAAKTRCPNDVFLSFPEGSCCNTQYREQRPVVLKTVGACTARGSG